MNNICKSNSPDCVLSLVCEIEKKVPIEEVVREYVGDGVVHLESSTRFSSPFVENDDECSIYVHNGGNAWKCFKSGKGGNVIDFVVQAQQLDKSIEGRTVNSEDYAFAIDWIVKKYSDKLNHN